MRLTSSRPYRVPPSPVLVSLWTRAADPTLAGLCRGLLFRRLYKSLDLSHLPPAEAAARTDAAHRAVESAGGEPAYDLFLDEPRDTPYETYEPDQCPEGKSIVVVDAHRGLIDLGEVSPLPAALNRSLAFRRLHVAPGLKEMVGAAVGWKG